VAESFLVVVAHPDDEVLGCGGMLSALAEAGTEAKCCILSSDVDARTAHAGREKLLEEIALVHSGLGLSAPILGPFPNIRFGTVPHLEIVRFIEDAVDDCRPTVILTHHPQDLNHDHRETSLACQAAARLYQRRSSPQRLRGLYFMEVPSSTDWAFRGPARNFEPDTFFEVGRDHLARKLEALQAYSGVMREYPHPRSRDAVEALAVVRGGQSGLDRAEGFQTAFAIWSPQGSRTD